MMFKLFCVSWGLLMFFFLEGVQQEETHNRFPTLPTAPLIPLEPQYSLHLSQTNRELIEGPQALVEEKARIQQALYSYTFPWLASFLLLAGGGVCWIAYLTRNHWFKGKTRLAVPLSHKEQMDLAFQTLDKKNLLQKGFIEEYYYSLGAILLKSLQMFITKKKERTTDEMLQDLKNSNHFSSKQKDQVNAILSEIDAIKFAKKKPKKEDAEQFSREIHDLISNFD